MLWRGLSRPPGKGPERGGEGGSFQLLSSGQASVLGRVRCAVRDLGPPPEGVTPAEALRKLCVASFNNAFAQAGKEAPEGMGVFTCDCLGERIKAGDGLGTARETCTMEATRRFPTSQS